MKGTLDFGTYTFSMSKKIKDKVSKVNELKDKYSNISDEEFARITDEFRERLRNGESMDSIMVEALAVAREATKRILHKTPYDVQIEAAIAMVGEISGIIEEDGEYRYARERIIAEMKTGEGKTLVQILIAYLNLLEATVDEDKSKWKSVHIMTANDALAERDAKSNGKVFELLGFSCDFVPERKAIRTKEELEKNRLRKQKAYSCDVVYATATTIAFDYMDDNMALDPKNRYNNKEYGYAIIDEADDILLDKASTPLIISGEPDGLDEEYRNNFELQAKLRKELYTWATKVIEEGQLTIKVFNRYSDNKDADFEEDIAYFKDTREIKDTEELDDFIAKSNVPFDDPELENIRKKFPSFIDNYRYVALQDCIIAKYSILKDVDYRFIKDEKGIVDIVLIDSNTGRVLEKTRYSKGLQEAIEIKEIYKMKNHEYPDIKGIRLGKVTDTKAKITYPSFLKIYKGNVCGMTGTSDEEEFKDLYGFNTYYVPTRLPCIRRDTENEYYITTEKKLAAIIEIVKQCSITGQPVLIGTTSELESNLISNRLKELHIRHQLLNTNNAHIENDIISNAGLMGSITVATNMAGRGTDIVLGPGVKELGGLYVIGTTRNKSKRIDKQLRGRSGRQGDPGVSKYFCCLEDDLVITHFRGKVLANIMKYLSDSTGRIKNKKIIKEINRALSIRESIDKASRKSLEELNENYNMQRDAIYSVRKDLLECSNEELIEHIKKFINKFVDILFEHYENNIVTDLSHLIDVRSLYSKNKKVYKSNIKEALFNKFNSVLNSVNLEEYLQKVREKALRSIDNNWHDFMEELEFDQPTSSIAQESMEKYNYRIAKKFHEELAPNILIEVITYAINQDLIPEEVIDKNEEMSL